MEKLQGNLLAKLAASLLLLAFAFSAAMCGCQVLRALFYVGTESWQDTEQFYRLLQAREDALAAGIADSLKLSADETLTYVERQQLQAGLEDLEARMDADATWFRYQIKSADGQELLASNLREGETLPLSLEEVHYASFVVGEYYVAETDLSLGWDSSASYSFGTASEAGTMDEAEIVAPSEILIIECSVLLSAVDGTILDEFSVLAADYIKSQANFSMWAAASLVLLVLTGACLLYILWTAGHKAGAAGIVLTWQEKIFFDIYLIIMVTAGTAAVCGIFALCEYFIRCFYFDPTAELFPLAAAAISALAALLVGIAALTLRTFAVRLKARALAQTTLVCRVCGWLWRLWGQMWRFGLELVRSIPFLWKVITAFLAYFFADLLLFEGARYSGVMGMFWWLLNIAVLLVLCWWAMGFRRLRKGCQAISGGNLDHQIDTHRLPHELRVHAEELNNISQGLSSAVDEKMKSERFKAELITNVSHDLKTPLTSIINYVNLLKTTQQTDPTALEYIEVLDRKSQRLKKLTEDLVEASKASTGVLSVNREKIGMAQLIDQALGEWAEKLADRKLTVVPSLPEGETWVYADGRHLWRVMDNLLSNCAKYAMEGTRVYLDLNRGKGQVSLSVKNISREPLNIPPERLTERFVRGEASRSTEGSGLGLSIARSLTELQGGTFELAVDGDLFKAVVTLPQAN